MAMSPASPLLPPAVLAQSVSKRAMSATTALRMRRRARPKPTASPTNAIRSRAQSLALAAIPCTRGNRWRARPIRRQACALQIALWWASMPRRRLACQKVTDARDIYREMIWLALCFPLFERQKGRFSLALSFSYTDPPPPRLCTPNNDTWPTRATLAPFAHAR